MSILKSSILALSLCSLSALGAIVTTTDTVWGDTDANLGVTGFSIIDFETTALLSNVGIAFTDGANSSRNWDTGIGGNLPFVVSPADDTAGGAFGPAYGGGAWDGSHFLVNVPQIPITSYAPSFGWGSLAFSFAGGANAVGFSVQQVDSNDTFWVNGTQVTDMLSLFGATNGQRQGYVLFTATSGDVINTLEIRNAFSGGFGDGFAIDHLAIQAADAPEPATIALCGFALAGLAALRRKQIRKV